MAKHRSAVVFLRYWAGLLKSPTQARNLAIQCKPILQKGWHCHLVLGAEPEDSTWTSELSAIGVNILWLPRPRRNFDWGSVRTVAALCRRIKCDVFHCDNLHTSPLIAAFLAGVPVRVWCKRSMNSHFEQCRAPGLRGRVAFSTRVSYRLATSIVAVSGAVRDELLDLGAPPERLTVLNNPRPTLGAQPVPREEARRGFGYTGSEVVILSLGHAVPVKGWDVLLRAFARVASLDERARLLLVGSTTAAPERHFFNDLTGLVAGLHLQDRVHFAGHVRDVRAPLAAADVFVLPSRSEGCSNALLEALEAGLPCVATQVGNAADVIRPGTNGFLVERNNVEKLAKTLLRVVQDDDLRSSLTRHASLPDHILTRTQHANRIADLYHGLLFPYKQG